MLPLAVHEHAYNSLLRPFYWSSAAMEFSRLNIWRVNRVSSYLLPICTQRHVLCTSNITPGALNSCHPLRCRYFDEIFITCYIRRSHVLQRPVQPTTKISPNNNIYWPSHEHNLFCSWEGGVKFYTSSWTKGLKRAVTVLITRDMVWKMSDKNQLYWLTYGSNGGPFFTKW